ncbi:MAG TPA: LysR substrate-binding domain-containing protein [Trueperaceae bacterium]
MAIEAEQLVTFALVAKHGTLSAAALERHRSQPAISGQLKRLTEAVGEPLYRRSRYGVELTEAGEMLLPYAEALRRALEGARGWSRGRRSGQLGQVRIAASMTVAVYLLPGILVEFHRRHPLLELRLLTRNSLDALALLERAEADLAVVEGPVPPIPDDFASQTIFHDEIVLAVRPDHALAGKGEVAGRDLPGLAIVQREPGSGTREVVELALAEMHLPRPGVRTVLEATGIEAVKEAVLQGFGAGFISRLAVRREVEAGTLVALTLAAPGFERSMTLLHPKPEFCTQAARRLIHFLTSVEASS